MLLLSFFGHANVFNIVPKETLPTSMYKGEIVKAYYTITNTTGRFHSGNYIKYLPPNVSQVLTDGQITNLCGATFNLASGAQCTLELNVSGPVNAKDPNPKHHLFACLGGCVTCCAGTYFPLNVTLSSIPKLLSITITPSQGTILEGATQQYTAIGTYSNGKQIDISSSVVWFSSNNNIASIVSGGLATGVTVGRVTINAQLNSITSNNANLTVQVAPTVTSTNPTNGSANVPLSTNIGITFSLPMNTSTLIPGNFQLYNTQTQTYVSLVNPIYSNSNKTVTFSTNTSLHTNSSYQIIIPTPVNITSSQGVPLNGGGVISNFTTASSGSLCNQTWVLNAGNNTLSNCSSDSANGGLVSCSGENTPVGGASLNNPTAMIWSGLLLSITNANGSNPLIVIDTTSTPTPPFTGTAIANSTAASPTGLAALNGMGWIANDNGTLTYCTTAQTGTGSGSWSGCSVSTPTNYPATVTSINVVRPTSSNTGALFTANTATNSISACPISNVITIANCNDAGGSGFNEPTFIVGSGSPNPNHYVLITNKGNSTVSRCDVDATTFVLSNCVTTGSNFNQPVSIYESDNGFAYITNQVDNSVTVCSDSNGTLTSCTSIAGNFNEPIATIVGTCG